MGNDKHDHDHHNVGHHAKAKHRSGVDLPEVTPKLAAESVQSVRARPQYDPVVVAKGYLDDMEAKGRLHFLKKNKQK
jgi:hypothetical protein